MGAIGCCQDSGVEVGRVSAFFIGGRGMVRDIKRLMETIEIPSEDNVLIEECINTFKKEQEYNENIVADIFEKYNKFTETDIVMRVTVLNSIYGTHLANVPKDGNGVVDIRTVAKCIMELENDFKKIEADSGKEVSEDIINLVEKIRSTKNGYNDVYSFATKYCAWSFLDKNIPIVDSKVKDMLYRYSKKQESGMKPFKQDELLDYRRFVEIYKDFITNVIRNENIRYKEVDMFLWQYAKNIEDEFGLKVGL